MKLFIVGHGRHGKDTVAEFITKQYGLTFESSSMFAAEKVVRPYLEDRGIVYDTLEECYADRVNHRMKWFDAILQFNTPNKSKLSRAIFGDYDMYVGIRSREEFLVSKPLSDLAIWVEAAERKPEIDPSCEILKTDCDVILDNNTTESDLRRRITRLFDLLIGHNCV